MLNGIVYSQKVRVQMVVASSQSTGGSSFIPPRLKEWQEIEMLKETLWQLDEEMRRWDEEQR
jgi:hypothetical protein